MTDHRGRAAAGESREWNAAAYHAVSDPQFTWGLRVLDRVDFAGDEHVLDAGCGSARLTKELAARIPAGFAVGCDLSENMTHAAARTLGDLHTTPVVCANLLSLPFSHSFDVIFSTATFHWVLDHDRLFSELCTVLRDGGRMEAQCGGGPNLAIIHGRADALAAEAPFRAVFGDWREPWCFAAPEETQRRLLHAGFHRAHCWLEHAPTRFPDAERYRAFVETVVLRPYLVKVSNSDLRKLFVDTIVAEAGADEPSFTLDYWRLNISAAT